MRLAIVAAVSCVMLSGALAPAVAQASCSEFQAVCAQRCKVRAPTDKNCVSDHCTPKLQQCRSTGCWQEGQMYGGKETCNLKRT